MSIIQHLEKNDIIKYRNKQKRKGNLWPENTKKSMMTNF